MERREMKKLMKTILSDTREFYADDENICSVACEMVYEDDEGRACAVGRYLKPESRKLWASRKYESLLGEGKNCVINKLSEKSLRASFIDGGYGKLPLEFWNALQSVHDSRLDPSAIAKCEEFIDGFKVPRKKRTVTNKKVAKKRKVKKSGNKLL